jgi:hypothetical protein
LQVNDLPPAAIRIIGDLIAASVESHIKPPYSAFVVNFDISATVSVQAQVRTPALDDQDAARRAGGEETKP